jgi:hypothetical protein
VATGIERANRSQSDSRLSRFARMKSARRIEGRNTAGGEIERPSIDE